MPLHIEAIVLEKCFSKLTRDPSIKTAIMSSSTSIGSKPNCLESESESTPDMDDDSFG